MHLGVAFLLFMIILYKCHISSNHFLQFQIYSFYNSLYFLGLCHSFGPWGCSGKGNSVLERGALWETEEGNLVWVFQDLGRGGVWVKHTRCAGIKTIMFVFDVHSYLGFGLKAARLATLGALNMEGMFI